MFGQYSVDSTERFTNLQMLNRARLDNSLDYPIEVFYRYRNLKNTMRYTDRNGIIRVRYQNTDIFTLHPSGAVTLDTGGFNTMTTRRRMNMCSWDFCKDNPFHVWPERGVPFTPIRKEKTE